MLSAGRCQHIEYLICDISYLSIGSTNALPVSTFKHVCFRKLDKCFGIPDGAVSRVNSQVLGFRGRGRVSERLDFLHRLVFL